MSVNMEGLADAIVNYRAKHGMSQERFAEKCKLTKRTIGAIENGYRKGITRVTERKILNAIEEEE